MRMMTVRLWNKNEIHYDERMLKMPIDAMQYVKMVTSTPSDVNDKNGFLEMVSTDHMADAMGYAMATYNPCPYCIFILEEY